MKTHFALMAEYNAWANARVYSQAKELPDEQYLRNVGVFFGSLHGTLNHLLVADRIWMRRFTGIGEHPSRLDATLFDELTLLDSARKEEDQRIRRYIDSLSDEDIRKPFNYTTTKGMPQCFPLGELLAHFFNHQTHHRGQAHCILTLLGTAEPQPLDLLALLRAKA